MLPETEVLVFGEGIVQWHCLSHDDKMPTDPVRKALKFASQNCHGYND